MISTLEESHCTSTGAAKRPDTAPTDSKKSWRGAAFIGRIIEKWPPLVVFAVSLTIYCLTCAPSITWRNGGADGGDLATAIALGGLAHPTGYPLYVMLGQIARVLPFGELGGRLALFSAIETAAGCAFVCAALRLFLAHLTERPLARDSLAVATSLCLAFAPTLWQQATIVEVYGLTFLFTAALIWLFAKLCALPAFFGKGAGALVYAFALISGLAIGHHRTAVFSVAAVLIGLSVLAARVDDVQAFVGGVVRAWRGLLLAALVFGAAIAVPQLWLLRANPAHAPANWGGGDIWWIVSGDLYRHFVLATPPSVMVARAGGAALSLLLSLAALNGLALVGIIGLWRATSKPLAAFLSVMVLLHGLFALTYGVADASVYAIAALTAWLIAAGVGAASLLRFLLSVSRANKIVTGAPFLLLLAPLLMLVVNYGGRDLHAVNDARAYAVAGLDAMPPHALILAADDDEPFALWYGQHALGLRPDVAIVHVNMLRYTWYVAGLRRNYPTLVVPPNATNGTLLRANPERPAYVTDTGYIPFGYDSADEIDAVLSTGHHLYAVRRQQ